MLFRPNYSGALYCCPTRIISTWIPSWKKAQIWGATSSQAFPIVLSLSSSSNVVFAYRRDRNVCEETVIKNKHTNMSVLTNTRVYLGAQHSEIWEHVQTQTFCTRVREKLTCWAKLVYTCTCVHNIQKLKHTHCHSSPNLLLHTIPTSSSLWKQALQRQHTHSHTKNSRGPVQITSNCATNALCAKSSNIYCTLIVETLDVCGYSALCGKYQRLAISVFSHVQWGMKALKSTPN